jgi:hypothetical protein
MSWKLAELKWRHDVGLYESRWEKESGVLPVDRKRAVEAFERLSRVKKGCLGVRQGADFKTTAGYDDSLAQPLLRASPKRPATASVESTSYQRSRPPSPRDRGSSFPSLSPFLGNTFRPYSPTAVSQRPVSVEASTAWQPVTPSPTRPACQKSSQIPLPTPVNGRLQESGAADQSEFARLCLW